MRDSNQHYPCAFPSHSHLLQDFEFTRLRFEFTRLRIEFEVWIFRQLCSLRGSPPLVASLQWLEFNPAGPANYPGRLVGASASFSASLLHILSLSCSRFPLRTTHVNARCAHSQNVFRSFRSYAFLPHWSRPPLCFLGSSSLCASDGTPAAPKHLHLPLEK